MASIEIEGLGYSYAARSGQTQALRGIDLRIEDGEFLCVIGPSGCGKTTLLRILAGLQPPGAGRVRIDGAPVEGPGADRSIVFQDYALFPWLTARGNVQFALRQLRQGLTRSEAQAVAEDFLRKVDMAHAADRYPHQLSGGMCQRVAIARALASDTDILLMDEPFGALDAKIRAELQALLVTLRQDGGKRKTVVFVTHDVREALQLADRVLFMQLGRVTAEIPVELPRPRDTLPPRQAARLSLLRKELMVLFGQSTHWEGAAEGGLL